jgi:hypothetical protein
MDAPPTPPRKRAVKLETARDVRKFVAKLVNGVFRDEIDGGKAGKIGFLLGIFIRSLEVDELEKRISQLENR